VKTLWDMIFNDSSLEEGEEDDGQVKLSMAVILNDWFSAARLGSQVSCLYINRDRVEGHAKYMRDYFNPNATYRETCFAGKFEFAQVSSSSWLQKSEISIIIGLSIGWVHCRRSVQAHWWCVSRMFECFPMGVQPTPWTTMCGLGKTQSQNPFEDTHGVIISLARVFESAQWW
jgi:hypothetical protein